MHAAVVGHVEWIDFARVARLPRQGEIVHAREAWQAAAGGGAVAAVQLARLAGGATFLTALGDDEPGRRAVAQLERQGVAVHVAWRPEPTRRGFTYLDDDAERTITVLGPRMVPHGDDPLPWQQLDGVDALYFTAGDPAALRHARRARRLVATPRADATLAAAGVTVDALVHSADDARECAAARDLEPRPRRIVATAGSQGGHWAGADGRSGAWRAAPLPGEPIDSYGCGDSFAAGLAYGLAAHDGIEAALDVAARCGAACLTGRGPYGNQLAEP